MFVRADRPEITNSAQGIEGNPKKRGSISALASIVSTASKVEGGDPGANGLNARRHSITQLLDQPMLPSENADLSFVPRQYDEGFMSDLNRDLRRNSVKMRRSFSAESFSPPDDVELAESGEFVSDSVPENKGNMKGKLHEVGGTINARSVSKGGRLTPSKVLSQGSTATQGIPALEGRSSSPSPSPGKDMTHGMQTFQLPEVDAEMHPQIIRRAAQKHLELMDPLEMSVMMALVLIAMRDCNTFSVWLRHVELVAMETIINCIVDIALDRKEQIFLKRNKASCKQSKRLSREIRMLMQITLNKLNTQVHARLAAVGMDMLSTTTVDVNNTVSFDLVLMSIEDYRSCLLEESVKQECGMAAAHRYRLTREKVSTVDAKADIVPYLHWMPYADCLGDGAYFAHAYFVARPHESNQVYLLEKKRLEALAAAEKESRRPVRLSPALRRQRTREKMKLLASKRSEVSSDDGLKPAQKQLTLPPLPQDTTSPLPVPIDDALDVNKLLSEDKVRRHQLASVDAARDLKYRSDLLPSNDVTPKGVQPHAFTSVAGASVPAADNKSSLEKNQTSGKLVHLEVPRASDESQIGLLSVYVPSSNPESNLFDNDDDVRVVGKGRRYRRYLMETGSTTHPSVILEQEEDRGQPLPMALKLNYFGKHIRSEKRLNLMFRKQLEHYKAWDVYSFENE